MPVTNSTDQNEGWTLADRVEELRGKYHLKTKDSEAHRESSQQEIKEKHNIIADLRQENWNKRIQLAQHENGDEQVIKTVFKDDRQDRLGLQRYSAEDAIETVDQKMCETAKMFNLALYEREKREAFLVELETELNRMVMEQKSPEQVEAEQSVTMLENSLDKARIKYDTARIISCRYHEILDKLKEESLTLPAKLDAMEQALIHQRAELKELREMAKDAMVAKDQTKKALNQVEHDVYMSRRRRDAELNETRKEVERRKAEAEKVERRHARATLILDSQDQKVQQELLQKQHNQQKILTYEEAYRQMREATHVNDIDEVVERVLSQGEKRSRLKGQVAELETQRQRLTSEYDRLKQLFHDMKYSGEQTISRGQHMLEQLQDTVYKEEDRRVKLEERLKRSGDTLIDVNSGVTSLLTKLIDVSLRPPEHNYTQGNVFNQLDLSSKKMEQLLKELSTSDPTIKDKLQCPEFQEFLENRLHKDNTRIKICDSESKLSTLSEFEFDQDHEHAPTRMDIKKMGQKMMDTKIRPRRKKQKK